mmetsp:Transcript_45083/g.116579  ORF Transcript_45083/g.116579 Transcript_45083/m.116579 type:complete len:106 (-) Transcript_45083:675-992(-)
MGVLLELALCQFFVWFISLTSPRPLPPSYPFCTLSQQSAVTASHVKRALEMVVADDRFLEILAEKLASALSETARHSHPPPAYHVSHPQHLQANVFPHSHPNHHH